MNKQLKLNFAEAMISLRDGEMVAREGWVKDGIFIFEQKANVVSKDFIPNFKSLPDSVKTKLVELDIDIKFNASITMFDSKEGMQPGWIAFDEDLDATDWTVIK